MNKFFISDTHFFHLFNRPFKTAEEMNNTIIRNWNVKVKPEDMVYFLGDWGLTKSTLTPNAPNKHCLKALVKQLNGTIIFIRGSHDENNGINTAIQSLTIVLGGYHINLVHDPKHAKESYIFNFCGHWHGTKGTFIKQGKTTIVDLSVENWNYSPVTINEIFSAYAKWLKEQK